MPSKLLVIDDEPNITFSLQASLAGPTLRVFTASTAREGLDVFRDAQPDVVLLDVRLPDFSGLEAYQSIRAIDSRIPVIIMTAFTRTETAIEATRQGAFDYLTKPVDLKELKLVLNRAIEISRMRRVPALVGEPVRQEEPTNADIIVGTSPAMQELYKKIGRVAATDAPVLILGESGTGKELVSRAIYHYSQRSQKPFLAINCAAIPEALLESELFGHERGAFTGADQRRIGKFEQVNGGTILLDEIGDMSPATQAKALRLLQQQQFERIGGNATIQTDVRIIAATNRDIESMVNQGTFRRDLYFRLNVFTIHLPPLRERLEDIPLLARNYLSRVFADDPSKAPISITEDALSVLQQYSWPGNVRELESALRFAMAHASSNVITANCLPDSCRGRSSVSPLQPKNLNLIDPTSGTATAVDSELSHGPQDATPGDSGNESETNLTLLTRRLLLEGSGNVYRLLGSSVDRIVLPLVMEHVHGNQAQAAELLGISRMTLRSKLRALETPPLLSSSSDDTARGEEAQE